MRSFQRFGLCVLIWTLAAFTARAEPEQLSGAAIKALLPTIVALSNTTKQTFSAAGATTYTDRGRVTHGAWRVDKGVYCSQWPPAREWACYKVLVDEPAGQLVWVDEQGYRTLNLIVRK